jgi:hypothetical protein
MDEEINISVKNTRCSTVGILNVLHPLPLNYKVQYNLQLTFPFFWCRRAVYDIVEYNV